MLEVTWSVTYCFYRKKIASGPDINSLTVQANLIYHEICWFDFSKWEYHWSQTKADGSWAVPLPWNSTETAVTEKNCTNSPQFVLNWKRVYLTKILGGGERELGKGIVLLSLCLQKQQQKKDWENNIGGKFLSLSVTFYSHVFFLWLDLEDI